MTPSLIDRKRLKAEAKTLLADAQVSPKAMVALYLGLLLVLDLLSYLGNSGSGILSTFISILTGLVSLVLGSGFTLYCMAIRRGERAEFFALFDGFSMAGKIILLNLLQSLFIGLWSTLFLVPGIVAAYRYRFALYNLYENPHISALEALNMSKRQTLGYKMQLFQLDLSYLGWFLLSGLPLWVEYYWLNAEMTQHLLAGTALPEAFAVYSVLPGWGWLILASLWQLAVSLFYMAHMQCVELGYFETAKSSSGVTASRKTPPAGDGPDSF